MSVTLKSTVFAGVDIDWRERSDDGWVEVRDVSSQRIVKKLSEGTGDAEANQVWHTGASPRELLVGVDEHFDLHAMIMPILGKHLVTFTFIEIRAIFVALRTITTGALLRIGPGDTNPFIAPWRASTNWNNIGPGSPLLLANLYDGYDVNGGARMIKLANAGGVDLTYDMAIVGTTTSSSSSGS